MQPYRGKIKVGKKKQKKAPGTFQKRESRSLNMEIKKKKKNASYQKRTTGKSTVVKKGMRQWTSNWGP